jgi:hypothetical protein
MSIVRLRVRKPENPYVMLDKTSLNDSKLSFRAKGIHAYLISRPDNWEVHVKQLVKESPREGRDAILSALRELEERGYLGRGKIRDKRGRLQGIETVVYEKPDLSSDDAGSTVNGFPGPGEPVSGKPGHGNPPLINKEAFTQNSLVLKKEKKEKAGRDRDKSKRNGNRQDEPPPTPEQQDAAVGAVKGLLDGFLGRFGGDMPPAETDAAEIAQRKADQLARAKKHGLLKGG